MPDNETRSYISKVNVPSVVNGNTVNNLYYVKDEEARSAIQSINSDLEGLSGAMHYIGALTSGNLEDGSNASELEIDHVTTSNFNNGDVIIYEKLGTNGVEFVYSNGIWREFGSTGSLGSLAFKSSATGSVVADGSVNSSFTGTAQSFTSNSYTPEGSITVSTSETSGGNYTPTGSISSVVTGVNTTGATDSVNSMTSQGTLPSLNQTSFSVTNETLSISLSTLNQGSLPTYESKTVLNNINVTTGQPSFIGNSVQIEGSFNGTSSYITTSVTPSGSINSDFTGSSVNVTVS